MDSPQEFFDEVVELIGNIVRTFNKDSFPQETIKGMKILHEFLIKNTSKLNRNREVESILADACIDLQETLREQLGNILNDSTKLGDSAKKKDFNLARNIIKEPLRKKFIISLSSEMKGELTPAKIWKKSFAKLVKILS